MDIITQVGIVLGIFLLFTILLISLLVHTLKSRKRAQIEWNNKIAERNAIAGAQLSLVSGLPLAERTNCQLFVTDRHLLIEAQNQSFQVEISKMIAAQTKTDVDIEREVTSSTGQAIVGGLLFGPVGAIVGARTKTKRTATVTCYLIINYTNQSGDTAVLAFDEPGSDKLCKNISGALSNKIQSTRAGTVTNL